MIKTLKLIVILGIVFQSLQIAASEPYKPLLANPVLEPWRWTEFPKYDTIRISCLARGRDNGMWMGIGNAAVYYDGYQTTQFIPDSSTIHSLTFGPDNKLLVATDKGILRYQDGNFRKILNFTFNSQRNFSTDQNGNAWIGCNYGLLQITENAVYCLNPEGYFEISGTGQIQKIIRNYTTKSSQFTSVLQIKFPVYNLTISSAQRVWMAVDLPDKNLASINLTDLSDGSPNWNFTKAPTLSIPDISGICEHQNSVYLVSNNVNIELLKYSVSGEKWESINLKSIGGDNVQNSILSTPEGNLWIGGHSKLYSLADKGWKVYQYPEVTLPLSYIQLYLDSKENLFVFGANGSLMKLDLSNSRFCTFQGLNFTCNTPDGKYWFTTNAGTIVAGDRDLKQFTQYSSTDGLMSLVMTIRYSKKSGLWAAGSHHGKAAVARFQNGRWNMKTFPDLYLGIAYNGICELGDSAMAFPANGVLELDNTHYEGGFELYNYSRSEWTNYSKERVPQRIPSMVQTKDGKIWFSGNNFAVFSDSGTTSVELPAHSPNWIDDVAISPSGQIWVAQGGTGLFLNKEKNWKRFTTFDGLASNMVTNLLVESDSSVYVATDKGISFYDGKQFIPQIIHPELNIQREKGYLRKSADGALWINRATREWYLYDFKSSVEDPAVFETTMYRKENQAPKTSISFSNNEISSSGNVIITYKGTDFWNQSSSEKIQFSYRLNDHAWSPFSEEKTSVFLDLDPGNYSIAVRSRDLDNNIEAIPARISFSILPPVYSRTWFILTILTFLGIIVWLLVRLYSRNRQIHELDQLKLRLFTDISHELKTPLTLISLPLQKLLDQSAKKDKFRENLELIYNNVQRLTNLVNQVVDFRRLEAGKIQLETSPGDIVLQLRNMASYYAPLAHEKNIRFEFHCQLQEFWASYDADKLEKIVVNLLSNAFKFTPENEKVELQFDADQLAGIVHISVSDSGPGIPEEMQQNIFDRFYRLRNEKLSRIPGSGIGLSLVKELVALHKGTIEVQSDGIHGTSFQVSLPVVSVEKTKIPEFQEKEPALNKIPSGEKTTVLLIEDEEAMLRFISGELAQYFEVAAFGSVEKAYEWLNSEMPDLIISDVMLPGMTGTEFCQKLKSNPQTSHLPVILLTARDSEDDKIKGLGTGADDYITKPFRMNELVARCFNLIENRKRLKAKFADQEELEAKTFTQNSSDHQFLEKAILLVHENLDNPEFDVPQFCQEMHISKTLLYSKLKTLTGQSATEFVRNIRLKEARKLLLNNRQQQTIAEISYLVGFNDPLYFSRCFKKYFGVPPSEVGK